MGCDGGTIPKRKEIVKSNNNDKQARDKNADLSAKWQFCHLSGLRLKKPIVACQLGFLYNKDTIIEYLLNQKQLVNSSAASSTTTTTLIPHIRSMKDIKELKLTEKQSSSSDHQASSGKEQFKAHYVCPISNLDMNGKYKFYYILTCGCVFSERALRRVPNEKQCILCSKAYNPDSDLIIINGDDKEVEKLNQQMKSRKKSKKTKNPDNMSESSRPSLTKTSEIHELDEDLAKSVKRHKTEQVVS